MTIIEPTLPDRRAALLRAARNLLAEAGPDAGALLEPELAAEVARGLAADIAAAVRRRTAGAEDLEALVAALVDAVAEGAQPWRDALPLAALALERAHDFTRWSALVAPWLEAVEHALREAREREIVCPDLDPRTTAWVLRDALDRSVRVSGRFEQDGYRESAAALVRAALRPASDPRT